MSESQHSKAAVVRVKGVSFNFLQFLWADFGKIRQQQAQGNFAGSLQLIVQFIHYLPDSMKDEFRPKAHKIAQIQELIRNDALPQLREIPDLYIRGVYRNRLLQTYSYAALEQLIDEISTALNKLGYMENLKVVQEGDADGQLDWMAEANRRARAKRRGKKKSSPQGSID